MILRRKHALIFARSTVGTWTKRPSRSKPPSSNSACQRVPPNKLSPALEHHDGAGGDALVGGRCCEVPYQPVDEAADLAVEPPVVAEEEHLVTEQQGPLLGAGGTEVEDPAARGSRNRSTAFVMRSRRNVLRRLANSAS